MSTEAGEIALSMLDLTFGRQFTADEARTFVLQRMIGETYQVIDNVAEELMRLTAKAEHHPVPVSGR